MTPQVWLLLSDAVLALHLGVVLFVVGGLVVTALGNLLRCLPWVNTWTFRAVHAATIVIVAGQAWAGVVCPLTTLEMWLRERAGATTYGGDFIAHWLQRLLYWDAPGWVFTAAYSLFALAVLAVWRTWPPLRRRAPDAAGLRFRSLGKS